MLTAYFSDLVPCNICIQLHNDLMDRRQNETARVVIENLKDRYDDSIPEQISTELIKQVHVEMKRREKVRAQKVTPTTTSSEESAGQLIAQQTFAGVVSRRSFIHRIALARKALTIPIGTSRSGDSEQSSENLLTSGSNGEAGKFRNESAVEESGKGACETESVRRPVNATMLESIPSVAASRDSLPTKQLCRSSDCVDSPASDSLVRKGASADPRVNSSKSGGLVNSVSRSQSRVAEARAIVAEMRLENIIGTRSPQEVVCYCIIDKAWLEKWRKFVQAGSFEDIEFPLPPPGPISNHRLLRKDCVLRKEHARFLRKQGLDSSPSYSFPTGTVKNDDVMQELHHDVQYVAVSPGVWAVLLSIYGGGPAIFREDIDIYSPAIEMDCLTD